MLQEEKIIREHDSGRRPFTVPEGYFEGFTEKMMTRLAAQGNISPVAEQNTQVVRLPLWKKVMRYAAIAAVAAVGIGGAWHYMNHTPKHHSEQIMASQADSQTFELTDEAINDILDYEQLDNQQIAYYLTVAY